MPKRWTVAAVGIVVIAVLLTLWHPRTGPKLPANVREAFGVRVTLKSVKRVFSDEVEVVVGVRNTRTDQVIAPSSWPSVGRPRWPVVAEGEDGGPTDPGEISITCTIPAGVKTTPVAYDLRLLRSCPRKSIVFSRVDPSKLPMRKMVDRIETTLIWAGTPPRALPRSWGIDPQGALWQTIPQGSYAIVLKTRSQDGRAYTTFLQSAQDEQGNALEYYMCYGADQSRQRECEAATAWSDAVTNRSLAEKAIGSVSPATEESINDRRADSAEQSVLARPMPPQSLLYVFTASRPPKRLTVVESVQRCGEPAGHTNLSFGNVPIH